MVVVIIGVSPRIGVPTSVIVMAIVSVTGFVLYGLIDGQLSVALGADGGVTALGGETVSAGPGDKLIEGAGPGADAGRYDLFGLWLAAAPVVAFGAPLGSWASSLASDRQLVRFVIALAALETLSTIIFLEGLVDDPDPALITFAIAGGIVVVVGLAMLKRHRRAILGLPPIDTETPFNRQRLDTGPEFRSQLIERDDDPDDADGSREVEA
jgi:hypothetical protein